MKIKHFPAALFAAALLATPAAAQNPDDIMPELVAIWIDNQMPGLSPAVSEYGNGCITPIALALPDRAKRAIATAGDMQRGIDEVERAGPDDLEVFLPALQVCVETLFVGEQISWWVAAEYDDEDAETQASRIACFIAAVEPLSTEAKQYLFTAADFEEGVELLLEEDPDLAPGFEDAVEACD